MSSYAVFAQMCVSHIIVAGDHITTFMSPCSLKKTILYLNGCLCAEDTSPKMTAGSDLELWRISLPPAERSKLKLDDVS